MSQQEHYEAAVIDTFGVLPNSWKHHTTLSGIELLKFARFAYVDAPFPSLFKAKLLAYLSRFSSSQYCVSRHVGFLIGYGHAGGDPECEPLSADAALDLLSEPTPSARDLIRNLSALRDIDQSSGLPWSAIMDQRLIAVAAGLFLNIGDSTTTTIELSRFLGDDRGERLLLLLDFVRQRHRHAEARIDLEHDSDVAQMLAKYPRLSHWIQTYRLKVADELEDKLFEERMRLQHVRAQLSQQLPSSSPSSVLSNVDPRQVLSERELSTFECIGRGLSTKEIADRLDVSSKTIETYRARLKRKLGIRTMSELSTEATTWVLCGSS